MAATSTNTMKSRGLIGVIGDEDTVSGFLLAGIGDVRSNDMTNFLVVSNKTTVSDIEEKFRNLTTRDDIAILLINQHIAEDIRYLLDDYTTPVPAVLEIPSKDHPYDPSKDSILKRAKTMFCAD